MEQRQQTTCIETDLGSAPNCILECMCTDLNASMESRLIQYVVSVFDSKIVGMVGEYEHLCHQLSLIIRNLHEMKCLNN